MAEQSPSVPTPHLARVFEWAAAQLKSEPVRFRLGIGGRYVLRDAGKRSGQ